MTSPLQILDGNGYPVSGSTPWSMFAKGQVVAYTGTSGMIRQAVGTAVGDIVSDGTAPADGSTVTVGSITYRFKTVIAQINDVFINTTAANALINLGRAINGTGTPGTDYFTGTVAHPNVVANTPTATILTVSANLPGSWANVVTPVTGIALAQAGTSHVTFKDEGGNTITGLIGGDDSLGARLFLINCTTAAYFKLARFVTGGAYPVATTIDVPIAAGVPQPAWLFPGSRVAAVQQVSGGNLTVTEVLG